jgi:hypothetical protein
MKKKLAAIAFAGASLAMFAGAPSAGAAHSSVVTPNGECHDTTGNAAGKAQGQGAEGRQTWQKSLQGQQTADANNDVTQADSQCPAE